jgi:hypothetical protein
MICICEGAYYFSVAKVFELKLNAMLDTIVTRAIFGDVLAYAIKLRLQV